MPPPSKLDRDPRTAWQRLGRLTKAELIDRLLVAERSCAALYHCSMKLQARDLKEEWEALQAQKLPIASRDKVVKTLVRQRTRRVTRI
jgi:hypothetical protein